jgi:hypothetical protein
LNDASPLSSSGSGCTIGICDSGRGTVGVVLALLIENDPARNNFKINSDVCLHIKKKLVVA